MDLKRIVFLDDTFPLYGRRDINIAFEKRHVDKKATVSPI